MKEEIWKDVPGYEGLYQASNLGQVKSLERLVDQKNRTIRWPERILRIHPTSKGYMRVKLYKNSSKSTTTVHQVVARTFIENPNNLIEVNHKDGNKSNNHVDNLEWSTRTKNMKHAYESGLVPSKKGESSGKSTKLKESDVLTIRQLHSSGKYTYKDISKIYNIQPTTVGYIVTKVTWSHI